MAIVLPAELVDLIGKFSWEQFLGHCVIDVATLQLSAESPLGRSKGGE